MSLCKSCKAQVMWVRLAPSGKSHPLDPKLSRTGNIQLTGNRGEDARVLSQPELARAKEEGELLYTSHFATCPNAQSHRKRAS